jgi:hypothetical protein
VKKEQVRLEKERQNLEKQIKDLRTRTKSQRIRVVRHKRGEEGYAIDCEEMIVTGREIGSTGNNAIFCITRFKGGDFGFHINTNTQGNFILIKSEMTKLRRFLNKEDFK